MKRAFWCLVLAALCLMGAPRVAFASPPAITTPVTDIAGVVDAEDEERVAAALVQLRSDEGPQMAVVFVRSTEGQPIEDYTMRVAEAWGGGKKERDDGVVLLVAIADRRSRLEVGYGLEAKIPDAKARALLDGMKDDLRGERYGDAVLRVIRGVAIATGRPEPTAPARKSPLPEASRPPPAADVPTKPSRGTPWWQTGPAVGAMGYLAGLVAGLFGAMLLRRRAPREFSVANQSDEELMRVIRRGPPVDWQTYGGWVGALLLLALVVALGAWLFPTKVFAPYGATSCIMGFVVAVVAAHDRSLVVSALLPAPLALVWAFAGLFLSELEGVFACVFGSIASVIGIAFFRVSSGSTSIGSSSVRYGSSSEVRTGVGSSSSEWSASSSFGSSASSSSSFGSSSSSSSSWSGGGGGFGGGGASSSW